MIVEELAHYIIATAIDDYGLGELPDPLQIKLAEEDICIRVGKRFLA